MSKARDIEGHKEVCRHLYEQLSQVFIDNGVSSSNFSLLEKLYKKTAPQTILLSRVQELRETKTQNTELKEKLDKCETLIDAIYNVDTKDPDNPLVDISDLYTEIMTLIETHKRQTLKEVGR